MSELLGLDDEYIRRALVAYLEVNGDFSPVPVGILTIVLVIGLVIVLVTEYFISQINGDGSCLFRSIWQSLSFSDDTQDMGAANCKSAETITFTTYRLRLFAVYLMMFYSVGVSYMLVYVIVLT